MDSASCEQSFELRAVEILRVSAAASLSSKGESTLSTKAPHIGKKAMPAGSSSFIDPKHAGRSRWCRLILPSFRSRWWRLIQSQSD
ncbi:unnamed protein product [Urochloa humidicola]